MDWLENKWNNRILLASSSFTFFNPVSVIRGQAMVKALDANAGVYFCAAHLHIDRIVNKKLNPVVCKYKSSYKLLVFYLYYFSTTKTNIYILDTVVSVIYKSNHCSLSSHVQGINHGYKHCSLSIEKNKNPLIVDQLETGLIAMI